MKKIYKILIPCIVVLFVIVIMLIIIIPRNKVEYKIVSVDYEYYVMEEENIQKLEVPVFINQDNNEYMKKENIINSYFTIAYSDDKFKVVIDNIEIKDKVMNNDEEYYQYNIDLIIPFFSDEVMLFKDIYLNMEYTNFEHIAFPIGSIAVITKIDINLEYSNLKGLVRTINDQPCLCGVLVKINKEEDIVINKITPISNNAEIVNNHTRFVDLKENIDEYLPIDYNPYEEKHQDELLNITNGTNYLFISLGYKENKMTNSLGFIIDYNIDGINYKSLIYPFTYFKSDDIYKTEETIYEIPNYK